jgi:hypothetical protein
MNAAPLDRDRLAKLLGMMGSTHDGEVVAAARQAERLRADAGLTWHEIVLPALPSPRPQRRGAMTLGQAIQFVLDHEDALTAWESDFARSIQRQTSPLSPKQIGILERLVEKARRGDTRAP